jgi:hypothetical protein
MRILEELNFSLRLYMALAQENGITLANNHAILKEIESLLKPTFGCVVYFLRYWKILIIWYLPLFVLGQYRVVSLWMAFVASLLSCKHSRVLMLCHDPAANRI